MDFVPPVSLIPGPKSTYTRVQKTGATSVLDLLSTDVWDADAGLNPKNMTSKFAGAKEVNEEPIIQTSISSESRCSLNE
jgi:hypothetical protein